MSYLAEDMTFDQLFRYSEPKRVRRADTVRGPPLDIDAHSNAVYHIFNFKSFPSTTGLRHRGYIKFKKPQLAQRRRPLAHVPCEVDCTCPDYRYRWAWVNKQHSAGRVGASSLNQAHNRAPVITNPKKIPGLCKHILAARDYICGLMSKFPKGSPDTGEKLATLVRYADRRWRDMDALVAKAKDAEKWFDAVRQARNAGRAGDLEFTYRMYVGLGGQDIGLPRGVTIPAAPAAPVNRPPGEDDDEAGGDDVPPLPPRAPRPPRGPVLPAAGAPDARRSREERPTRQARPARNEPPEKKPTRRKREESLVTFAVTRVDNVTSSNGGVTATTARMKNQLNEALVLVEELEQDEMSNPTPMGGGGDVEAPAADVPPPSEPPVDDEAVGADTEGNVALELLSQIRDLLATLVGGGEEGAPEDGEGAEGGALPPGEGGEGGEGESAAIDAIPEVPDDEKDDEDEEEDGAPGKASGGDNE